MATYKVDTDSLTLALRTIVEQFREANPTLARCSADLLDGSKITIHVRRAKPSAKLRIVK